MIKIHKGRLEGGVDEVRNQELSSELINRLMTQEFEYLQVDQYGTIHFPVQLLRSVGIVDKVYIQREDRLGR
jgi:hypothetical protein